MYSLTQIGTIATLVTILVQLFNIQLPYTPEEVEKTILTVVGLIGAGVAWYGRWRKGDITFLGFRKNNGPIGDPIAKVQEFINK